MTQINKTGKSRINIKAVIALVLCLIIAVIAVGVLLIQTANKNKQLEVMEQLAKENTIDTSDNENAAASTEVTQQSETVEEELTEYDTDVLKIQEMGVEVPDRIVDFEALQQNTNPDIYAWIYIPDTKIDYPVLQHPTDNTYYLNYNIDGTKGYPGCIYTEDYNSKDFSDPVTVMYGHNMKSGAMFAGLHKYEDSDYFEKHPYIYVYTPDRLLLYQIYAAYEYSDAHILKTHDFRNKNTFLEYIEEMSAAKSMNSNVNKDMEVNADDHILTLSTCISNKPNNRYLVQGVLVNED